MNTSRIRFPLGLLIAVAVLLTTLAAACGQTEPTPTPTQVQAAPTATVALPTPTSTTASPRATATATQTPATPTPTPALFPFTIIDSNGREITFDAPPERIIPYDGAAVEMLFAMGEGHRVVGTHSFVSYPPEADAIARIGSAFAINLEETVALEPDLVYLFFDRFLADLEGVGIKVLYTQSLSNTVDDVLEHFRLWGRLTGNVQAAEREVALFQARLDILKDKLKDVERGPRVYNHTFGFWTPGPDTLTGDIFKLLKAEMVTEDISGYAQISPEEVLVRDPEVIITSADAVSEITDDPALQGVTAVKNGRVLVPERAPLFIAGPRLIDVIEEIAEFLYPELFQ
jgi:iron complex transport system substrate-binding protein